MKLTYTPVGQAAEFCAADVDQGTEADLLQGLRDTILELDLLTEDEYEALLSDLPIEVVPDRDLRKLIEWFNVRCKRWQVTLSND